MTEHHVGKHAVVIGASMGGLLCSAALAKHFEKVTLVDRDTMPTEPDNRKGTPQGRHIHIFMNRGLKILDGYCPNLIEELIKNGAALTDWNQLAWFHHGVWRPRFSCGLYMLHCTRFFLEFHVRQYMKRNPKVTILEKTTVSKLITTEDRSQVTGLVVSDADGTRQIEADLVVDSSGRGTKAPQWLEELGYGRPPVTELGIDLAYTSRICKAPTNYDSDFSFMVIYPKAPKEHRAGFLYRIENGLWVTSLNGYFGDHAPCEEKGFFEFAKSLPRPEMYKYLTHMEPVSDFIKHRVPSDLRRHYNRMSRFPEGYVVMGDAHVAFNPIFGQGMSGAAMGVEALDHCLSKQKPGQIKGLSKKFQRRQAWVLEPGWLVTTSSDFRYPQTTGKRWPGLGPLNWYMGRLFEASSTNPHIYAEFLKLLHLLSGLWPVVKPSVSLPVVAHAVKALYTPLEKRALTGDMPPIEDIYDTPLSHPDATRYAQNLGPLLNKSL